MRNARRSRVRVVGHSWSELIPTLLDRRSSELPPIVLEVASRPDHAPVAVPVVPESSGNGTAQAQTPEPPAVGVGGRGS